MKNAVTQLPQLRKKKSIDRVIRNTRGLVVVLRFGKDDDLTTMELDHTLSKCKEELSHMAAIYTIDIDDIPLYTEYFDIVFMPSTVFFFNSRHIKVDYGTPDNTKFVGAFKEKQDLIDLIETIYTGGMRNKFIVTSPIPVNRVQQYNLLYGGY